ncbi:MAG: glycosyl hydrolase family 31, partial [Mucilaginibacter sp.]
MRRILFILIAFIPAIACGQIYQKHTVYKNRVSIQLSNGILDISPLTDKAIRVQFEKDLPKEKLEFVLVNPQPVPEFKTSETALQLIISTKAVTATFDKQSGVINFSDK